MRRLMLTATLAALALAVAPARADTIEINGVTRTFIVQPPAEKPAPLVIVLHGRIQRGADMIMRTAWPLIARRDGFAVVYPDGLNNAWADSRPEAQRAPGGPPDGSDDVAFITGLIGKLVTEGVADAKRIYVTGVSNGAAMAMTLVCARADLFTAAATVVMNLTDESAAACHPSRPVPMLIMNGTVDPLVPYEGGRGSNYSATDGFWSTAKTLAFWRNINGCETADAETTDIEDKNPSDQSSVTRISSHCPKGRDVVLYRVNHGGHRMPGMFPDANFPKFADGVLGPQNGDIDGPDTIWAFFRRFP